jgi:hypothetical protein
MLILCGPSSLEKESTSIQGVLRRNLVWGDAAGKLILEVKL